MTLKRLYEDGLAHASYLVGCPQSGEALVLDPNRNLGLYLGEAAKERLRIVAVAETHIHADYLSGARELASRAGATLYVSGEGPKSGRYEFLGERNVRPLKDGDSVEVGAVRLNAMLTPGHTQEHLTFLATDTKVGESPVAAFTGDFVFVGDVGRPDLMESAVGQKGAAEPAARELFRSLERFRGLPGHLLVWPAHGAGSACGRSLGGSPVSSLGYELATSWAFQVAREEEFVREVLQGQPEPPPYYALMKRENRCGPPASPSCGPPRRVGAVPEGALVLDVRLTPEYEEAHLKDSLHMPSYRSFLQYAGWVVPHGRPITLVASDENQACRAALALSLIGIDEATTWAGPEIVLTAKPDRVRSTERAASGSLRPGALLLDVRSEHEWSAGHIEGAVNIPFCRLEERAGELPRNAPIEVYCSGGMRSAISVSILERAGLADVRDVVDGFDGYVRRTGAAVAR